MLKYKRYFFIGITIVLLLLLGRLGLAGWRLWQFQQAVNDLAILVEAEGVASIEAQVLDVIEKGHLVAQDIRFVSPLFSLAGNKGCVVKDAVYVAEELAPLAKDLSVLADPLYTVATADHPNRWQIEIKPFRDAWANAALDIDEIETTLARIRDERAACSGVTGRYQKYHEAVNSLLFLFDFGIHVPWDEALADSARWLVLLNNSDEIRATGGFTTAFFEIWVENGILNWRLRNSYVVDNVDTMRYHPRAPLPMYTYMEPMTWWFRDANWSPDHRTSSDMALRFFALDRGIERPLGVITVNFSAIDTLTQYIPSIQVRGKPFNDDTALRMIRDEWGADAGLPSRDPERKNFLIDFSADLAKAMAQQLGRVDQARLGLALEDMLKQRDVMVYTEIPSLAAYVAKHKWSGSLIEVDQDYFMPVDTNLGYNKVTPYINRHYLYAVDLQNIAEPAAHVEMTYTNTVDQPFNCLRFNNVLPGEPSYHDRVFSCFWNYVRVLFPAESNITSYDVHEAPGTWFQFTENPNPASIDALTEPPYEGVGTMLVVPIGDSKTLTFDYQLPEHVVDIQNGTASYVLYVQKQAGSIVDPELTIQITLPRAAQITSFPENAEIQENTLILTRRLIYDQTIAITWLAN